MNILIGMAMKQPTFDVATHFIVDSIKILFIFYTEELCIILEFSSVNVSRKRLSSFIGYFKLFYLSYLI